jgi:hypothetical protein
MSYIYLSHGNPEQAKKAFKLGQQAEEKLLPFFQPYDYGVKNTTQQLLEHLESRGKNTPATAEPVREQKQQRDFAKVRSLFTQEPFIRHLCK